MHVRVCVECGEEYRPGIQVCADCGGALEDRDDESPDPPRPAPAGGDEDAEADDEAFTDSVQRADHATDLTDAADRLDAEGIDCRIRPVRRRGSEHATGYRLMVAADDRERALQALGLLAPEPAPAGGDTRTCPACEAAIPAGDVECPECGLAAGDDPHQAMCPRCGQWLEGPACPDCGP